MKYKAPTTALSCGVQGGPYAAMARLGDSQSLHSRAARRATSAGLIRMITPRQARGSGQLGELGGAPPFYGNLIRLGSPRLLWSTRRRFDPSSSPSTKNLC